MIRKLESINKNQELDSTIAAKRDRNEIAKAL